MSDTAPLQNATGKAQSASKAVQAGLLLQRKCACGGSGASSLTGECEECKKKRLQRKLRIGASNDPLEKEADRISDHVMSMSPKNGVSNASPRIQRVSDQSNGNAGYAPASVDCVLAGPGRPLDPAMQQDMGQRFGYDFSHVRVHTSAEAARSAHEVNAIAYTVGENIVFGAGQFMPASKEGRRLIAHELTHVAQGNPNKLYRKLKVDAKDSDQPATAISMIAPLVTQLCPDFDTDTTTGDIRPKSGTPCSIPHFADVAKGSHKLGCCCLCEMTRPFGDDWRIIVSSTNAPVTIEHKHSVRMTPTSGPHQPHFKYWTAGPRQRTIKLPAVEAFGHELCGHAALMKIRAHPGGKGDRSFTDVHDPTVRVENALATEMHIAGPRRGLAGGGSHRGESLRVFDVGPFVPDSAAITPLKSQIAAAVNFLNVNHDLLYDTIGFRSTGDTSASISATRAANVQSAVTRGVTTPTVSVQTAPAPARKQTLTRAQPPTDGGVGSSRIVEIQMAIRPAGLIKPIGTPPPAKPVHVGPTNPGRIPKLKKGRVNECHELLAKTAWP